MNVFAISDFHLSINNPKPMNIFGPVWDGYLESIEKSWAENVTDEDLVLIAGDLSWAMTLDDAKADLDYFARFSGYKVFVRGNHDYWWKSISAVRACLPPRTYAVQNDAVKIGTAWCADRGCGRRPNRTNRSRTRTGRSTTASCCALKCRWKPPRACAGKATACS